MLTKLKKNNDIQNTKDSPLSETFIAGGPKVNLVNEETGADAQKKRRRKPHQRELKATGRG